METVALTSRITTLVTAASPTATVVAWLSTVTSGLALVSATAARVDLASPIYLESTT